MTARLAEYVRRFAKLRTDTSQQRWTARTYYRAPHKPLLLLAVMAQFEGGLIRDNQVRPTPELAQDFLLQWASVLEPSPAASFVLPFFHLRSEGFWHLVATAGNEKLVESTRQIRNATQLADLVHHAALDPELFELLLNAEARAILASTLIETYFVSPLQSTLREQILITAQASQYSQQLLTQNQPQGGDILIKARSQGFRRAVVQAYDRRCAFCGVRLITHNGCVVVDAAHIIPWSSAKNDELRNGLSLCKLCHWTFDIGFISVSEKYILLGSPQLRSPHNLPAQILSLTSRPILRPENEAHWPDTRALAWHYANKFMKV